MKIKIIISAILLSTNLLFSQYTWHNPKPCQSPMYDIFFVDSLYGWSVGHFGSIIKTTDGGKSWRPLYVEFDPVNTSWAHDLKRVHFYDRLNGIIIGGFSWGNMGTVHITSDGGETWEDTNPVTEPYDKLMVDMCVLSNEHTYICGPLGVYKSQTRGRTWEYLLGAPVVNSIFFLDSLNGWIADDYRRITRTTDGGKNWNTVFTSEYRLKKLFFVNEKKGWFIGNNDYWNPIHNTLLFETSDGGINWRLVDSTSSKIEYPEYNDLLVLDSLKMYVVGSYGIVNYTSDGGLNWIKHSIGNNLTAFNKIAFQGSKKWIVGQQTSNECSFYYNASENDADTNWRQFNSAFTRNDFHTIAFSDDGIGYLAGIDGTFFKTTNGGYNWVQLNFSQNDFRSISCPDRNNIFLTSYNSSELNYSNDAGESWNTKNTGRYENKKIKFFSRNSGFLLSRDLEKTTDGGTSWKVLFNQVYDFYFIDEQHGWVLQNAGIYNSIIYNTIDGGITWSDPKSFNAEIYNIYFINALTGWITSSNGLYKTSDGGSTWNVINNSFTDKSVDMLFTDEENGFFIIENLSRLVYYTGDGGNTVQRKTGFTSLLKLGQTSDEIWAAGQGGNLISLLKRYPTKVNVNGLHIPDNFTLKQNFPNPFNPSTTITYEISQRTFVELEIFNILGKKIRTLVSSEQNPGSYIIFFNAENLSSGVYLYQLKTDKHVITNKMLLLK